MFLKEQFHDIANLLQKKRFGDSYEYACWPKSGDASLELSLQP